MASSTVSARAEALRLYRDVLRATRMFSHTRNEQGQSMSEVLRRSARQEFEAGRSETDPELVAKMLITGRDCLMQVQEKVAKKQVELHTNPPSSSSPTEHS
ncbi:Complex 1 protein (Lyr family) protein [Balamuthia mandrillaris]